MNGGMVEGGGNDKKRRMRLNKKSFWSNRVLEFWEEFAVVVVLFIGLIW